MWGGGEFVGEWESEGEPGLNAPAGDLEKTLNFSVPQFLHLTGGVINNANISGLRKDQM